MFGNHTFFVSVLMSILLIFHSSILQIFFRDEDFIKKGTKQYEDFWLFFKKFQTYQNRQKQKEDLNYRNDYAKQRQERDSSVFDLPQSYHPR